MYGDHFEPIENAADHNLNIWLLACIVGSLLSRQKGNWK